MKRLCALIALTTALAGCSTIQNSSLFRPRSSTPPTTVTASTAPVTSQPLGASPASATYSSAPASSSSSYSGAAASVQDARALLEADRQLGIQAQEKGLGLAMAAVSDSATTVLTPAGEFEGIEAINRGLASSANAGALFWQPEKASIAASNDFGTTSGAYVQVLRGAEAVQGRYITVWRKDAGGVWRVVSNVIMPKPPTPAPARRR